MNNTENYIQLDDPIFSKGKVFEFQGAGPPGVKHGDTLVVIDRAIHPYDPGKSRLRMRNETQNGEFLADTWYANVRCRPQDPADLRRMEAIHDPDGWARRVFQARREGKPDPATPLPLEKEDLESLEAERTVH